MQRVAGLGFDLIAPQKSANFSASRLPMSTLTTATNYQIFAEPDGTLALICMRCLLTIGMGMRPDLRAYAIEHVCGQVEPLITNTAGPSTP